jgi:hypothetical protein
VPRVHYSVRPQVRGTAVRSPAMADMRKSMLSPLSTARLGAHQNRLATTGGGRVEQSGPEPAISVDSITMSAPSIRVDLANRAGGKKTPRGRTADDSSWRGPAHGAGFRIDHRSARAFSLWKADWKLPGAHSLRGLQRWQTAARTHQQARQLAATFLAGGSSANCRSG